MRQYRMVAAQLGITLTSFELEDLWVACVSGTNKPSNPPEAVSNLLVRISSPILSLDSYFCFGSNDFTTHCCSAFLDPR